MVAWHATYNVACQHNYDVSGITFTGSSINIQNFDNVLNSHIVHF